jgi:hypothetical protein
MKAAAWQSPEPPSWDPESTLAYMDRTGIAMQLLSNIPKTPAQLRSSNEYGAALVTEHPRRFGLLAALPTDDCEAALVEVERGETELHADGYAVTCRYNDVYLGDPSLEPLWAELDRLRATAFVHPDAYAGAEMGRPPVILDVAFETARTVTDMLYRAVPAVSDHPVRHRPLRGSAARALRPAAPGGPGALGPEPGPAHPVRAARTPAQALSGHRRNRPDRAGPGDRDGRKQPPRIRIEAA